MSQQQDLFEVLAVAFILFIAAIVLPLFAMYGLGGGENEKNLGPCLDAVQIIRYSLCLKSKIGEKDASGPNSVHSIEPLTDVFSSV